MAGFVAELFSDREIVEKITKRLPHLFYYAERESVRGKKVGMEVGTLRERILIALLVYKFGSLNVDTNLPSHMHDVDVRVRDEPLSIKTASTKTERVCPVKIVWIGDAQRAALFKRNFSPQSDYLFAHICWSKNGGLYYIPVQAQQEILHNVGRDEYLRLPKPGSNPRGIAISTKAMISLVDHRLTERIQITWHRPENDYDPYKRWCDLWMLD